ncbi:MAG: hypothetical protein J6A01_07540 [Proteobacteria bacterium]|nr:hypothetical protein [Pseudomonadota bacterium]
MKKISLFILIFLAAWLGLFVSQGWAQTSIFDSATEKNAYDEVLHGHYIKARQLAEDILKENPKSIGATYTLAYVFWMGEGNHMRAMSLLRSAIEQFESTYANNKEGVPSSAGMQVWHQRMYKELADIYAELDMRQEEIDTHKKVADLYHAMLSEDAVWPLIKLARFDEARAIAEQNIKGQDNFWTDKAYNDLTALEDARHEHLEAFHASQRSVEYHAGRSCVVLLNHARSLAVFLELNKTIEYYLKSASTKNTDCVHSPLAALASIYLFDAQWQKAISALLKARKRHVEKRMFIQTEMTERTTMAAILYAMGFSERAQALMQTVINAPARLGYDSLLKEQVDMANNVTFYAISQDALRRRHEFLDAYKELEPFWFLKSDVRSKVWDLQKEIDNLNRRLWSSAQKAFKQALNPESLKSFLVPFYALEDPSYNSAVIDVLGRRTAELFMIYQEGILKPKELDAMKVVFEFMRAYIAWRDGNLDKALEYVELVEKHIKPRMTLLLNQNRLIHADILEKQGKMQEYFLKVSDVYQVFPAALRQYDLKLPVLFDSSMQTTEDLQDAQKVLTKSTRFNVTPDAPFIISGSVNDQNLVQLCLSSKLGQRYACSSTDLKDYGGDPDHLPHLAEIIDNFHHAAFTPKVDLSQADLHSLDGSPVKTTADDALKDLLNTAPSLQKAEEDLSDLEE